MHLEKGEGNSLEPTKRTKEDTKAPLPQTYWPGRCRRVRSSYLKDLNEQLYPNFILRRESTFNEGKKITIHREVEQIGSFATAG